jgi:hypothetical protein
LRKALERISEADRRSLSSVIEHILYDYVGQREPGGAMEEKRRFPRKRISAPALVSGFGEAVQAGVVNDVSLGGIHFSVPAALKLDMDEAPTISVVFTLPQSSSPVTIQCRPRHIRANGQTGIGAALVDTDFQSYQALQNYLIE